MILTFLSNAMNTLVGAVLVLGIMIVVHEFGHFAAAKLLGVRVEVFSIGFGKRLWGFRRGDTDYRIAALPLGGYVKMAGVNAMELPDSEAKARPPDAGEFQHHPRWHRLIIAFAGPAANGILAVGLLTAVFAMHHQVPYAFHKPAVVGWVQSGGAAEQAGVKAGDRIVQIGGAANPTWRDVQNAILMSPGQPVPMQLLRHGESRSVTLVPKSEGREHIGFAGWQPKQPFLVTELERGMPGAKAGLKVGDEVLAADGKPMASTGALQAYLQTTKDRPVRLEIRRHGKTMVLTMTPQLTTILTAKPLYRVGFTSMPMVSEKLALPQAFQASVERCRKSSGLVLDLLGRMVERKVSVKQLSGPIEIVRFSGEVVESRSLNNLLDFMAMISLQLGLFNLLPIPILDGGLIAMLLVESAMRRDINEEIKMRLYQAAFVGLVLFAGFVIFNDVVKMLPGQ